MNCMLVEINDECNRREYHNRLAYRLDADSFVHPTTTSR